MLKENSARREGDEMAKTEWAFPRPYSTGESGQKGMTLRDWFAGKILAGILSNAFLAEGMRDLKAAVMKSDDMTPKEFESKIEFPSYAAGSYSIADAMLAERSK